VSDDPFANWPWKLGDHPTDVRQRAVALVPEMIDQLKVARDEGATSDVRREAGALLAQIYNKRCGVCGGELGWDPGDEHNDGACAACATAALRKYGRIP